MSGSHFKKVQKFKADFIDVDFAQYESTRTGLRVVFVQQQSPKIWCGLAVATEIFDDSGAPHTLEHLIFTASRSYNKGFLDRLATRSYGYTNAYTDEDVTLYELEAAGQDGFANILPVYLEHLIMPKLSDAACYTEVHHVDGSGNDAGVVYSEMQGRENDAYDLIDLASKRQIYPEGNGYRYHTGGLTPKLRVLTNEKIRDFHRTMYQPKNICVIVVGNVTEEKILTKLDAFEDTIVGHVPKPQDKFDRPWEKSHRSPRLTKSTRESVEFPEADESLGQIQVAYVGPNLNDNVTMTAMKVMTEYVSGGPVALLDRTLIEEEQLASGIFVEIKERLDSLVVFQMLDVATSEMDRVADRFFEILEEASKKPLNMSYLKDRLQRSRRVARWEKESTPQAWIAYVADDHVFGDRSGKDLRDVGSLAAYDVINEWTETEWLAFFRKWFTSANTATTFAKPSETLSRRLEQEEETRVKLQKQTFGEKGMLELAKKLEQAKLENDQPVPKELLQQYPIAPAESIKFITSWTAFAGLARPNEPIGNPLQSLLSTDKRGRGIPLFIQYEHVNSSFVNVGVAFNTHDIPLELRPLTALYAQCFYELPVARDGKRIEFEQVVAELERDTVEYSETLTGQFSSELLNTNIVVEPDKYATAVKWITSLMFDSIFDEQRLLSSLKKMIASLAQEKRDGDFVVKSMGLYVATTRESTARSHNLFVKGLHLKEILREMQEEPQTVIAKLERIREAIIKSGSFRCFVIGDVESGKIQNPVSEWRTFSDRLPDPRAGLAPLNSARSTRSEKAVEPGNLTYIMPLRTIDSSFLGCQGKGVTSYEDPRLPALTVAKAYLETIEGPLWNAIRGNGLAYGSGFVRSIEKGLYGYGIFRSPDAFKAFDSSKKVVNDYANGTIELDDLWLEDAISNIITGVAGEGETMLAAAYSSFMNQAIHGISKDYSKQFAKKVQQVTKKEVVDAMREFMVPLFEPKTTNVYVTCAPVMESKVSADFKSAGFSPESKTWADFRDDYGLGLDDLEDDEEDDVSDSEEDGEEQESGSEQDEADTIATDGNK
ncbi:MAG: hypothetical protein Q9159_007226 [Coniocarpon cinnabarinum]